MHDGQALMYPVNHNWLLRYIHDQAIRNWVKKSVVLWELLSKLKVKATHTQRAYACNAQCRSLVSKFYD